jgi:aerobic carbon-monoxide dehydrogenase medium subunit
MPATRITAYHRPTDLASVWALVDAGGTAVRLLAGGTDLVARCPAEVRELVDLSAAGLGGITTDDEGRLRVGAMTTFTELLEDPRTAAYGTGVLGEVLRQVGSVLHRNSATIGGHVARARLSDLVPVLLTVDAAVASYDGTEHVAPLDVYLATAHGPHVITAVTLPAWPAGSAAAFERFARCSFDHALLAVSCRVDLADDGTVADARVAVGEPSILGRRVPTIEQAVRGGSLDETHVGEVVATARETIECRDDWIATAAYRRHLTGVLVGRCLRTTAARLREGGR